MRGLAALYVVGFHILDQVHIIYHGMRAPFYVRLSEAFARGHVSVDVFIVLSGFCLMIPVAKAGGSLNRSIADFLRRRARRILPPYYACLALSALLLAARIGMQYVYFHEPAGGSSHFYTWYAITHLLMIHNFFHEYSHALNSSLWTVATEWQIYFVFVFVLLPVFKRFGPFLPIAIGYAIGLATYPFDFRDACLWYIGLFAMGMASADLCFSPKPKLKLTSVHLAYIAAGSAVLAVCGRYFISVNPGIDPMTDLFVGCFCASSIALLIKSQHKDAGVTRLAMSVLASRPCVKLGVFSYSLYLIHVPIILLAVMMLRVAGQAPNHSYFILYLVVMPICVVSAYVFHLIFERPYMNSLPKSLKPQIPPQVKTASPAA